MNEIGALRKLLAAFEAHEKLLAAYRTGSLRPPAKAIDTLTRVKTVLPAIRELAYPSDGAPHDVTTTPVKSRGKVVEDVSWCVLGNTDIALPVSPGTRVRVVAVDGAP